MCAKNVNTRVEVDFLRKFVSLLLKPQMILAHRFSTHCWDKRGPNETHVSHKKNRFDGKPTNQEHVESRVQSRSVAQHKWLQDSERTSATVTRCSMYGRMPTQMHPHETSRKTSAKPRVAWSQVSRFCTTGNRVLNVCTRTKINRSNVSIMGQIQEGRLAVGEKSLRKARSRTQCCQPCRQSRSRRVLSTVANLI